MGFSSCGPEACLPHSMPHPMSPPLAGVFLTTGPPGKSETMLSYTHFYESIDSAIIVQFHSHFSEHPPRSPCKRTELACFPLTIADLFLKEIYYTILYYYITLLNYIINHLFHFFIVNLLSPSVSPSLSLSLFLSLSLSLSLTHTHTHTHMHTW